MDLVCDERPSDSPFVELVWQSQSEQSGSFISMAEAQCSLVVTKYQGKTFITVRGPATRATPAYGPAEAEFFGIQFRAGVFMPKLPPKLVMDRHELNLPNATGRSFWLNGSAWEFPDYENAETFVDWLIQEGLLAYDPVVGEVLKGHPAEMSLRTVQRRFLQATGLTQNTMYQINRARYATLLLREDMSILEAVHEAGYFDQPHLTRSLKQFIGLTPAQIADKTRTERLSFLYKTTSFGEATISQPKDEYEKNNRIRVPDVGWRDGSAREMVLSISE
ncbi:MAG TPA: helix-turn-helix domain-containing protein [Anaerolineales bacterium]|nr:helix-turn-helix domain-containing protein [Anaerolineales bacterium]